MLHILSEDIYIPVANFSLAYERTGRQYQRDIARCTDSVPYLVRHRLEIHLPRDGMRKSE